MSAFMTSELWLSELSVAFVKEWQNMYYAFLYEISVSIIIFSYVNTRPLYRN